MCCLCDGGGGCIITHHTPAETQNQPRGLLQMDRCIRPDESALIMLHVFLFFFFNLENIAIKCS